LIIANVNALYVISNFEKIIVLLYFTRMYFATKRNSTWV